MKASGARVLTIATAEVPQALVVQLFGSTKNEVARPARSKAVCSFGRHAFDPLRLAGEASVADGGASLAPATPVQTQAAP